ncbi:sugar nucleotide-binding protein [Alphaproteobacteria bacterium]|nr:sugar nucleotide-binding protein [Alphaproteobacteria bacterium]
MNKQKQILVIGSDGFIGKSISSYLKNKKYNIVNTSRKNISGKKIFFDLKDDINKFKLIKPDSVIICAGITSVDYCKNNPKYSSEVNVFGVKKIIDHFKFKKSQVIYLSTSQVFNGKTPYQKKHSLTSPLSEYARQKLLSEKIILNNGGVVIRVTKILSKETELIKRWQSQLSCNKQINAFSNLPIAPLNADFVCEFIKKVIDKNSSGLFQLSPKDDIKYIDIAKRLANKINSNENLVNSVLAKPFDIGYKSLPEFATLDMAPEELDFSIKCPKSDEVLNFIGI